MQILSVGQTKGYGCGRAADVHQGNSPLQSVMSRLVEEVAEPNHPNRLTGKVQREPGRTAADQTRYGVQFLAAASKIVAGHDKVRGAEGGICRKQDAIVTVPESVIAGGLGRRCWLYCLKHRSGFDRPRLKQRERDLLLP